jgi:regulator of replication initiation timing
VGQSLASLVESKAEVQALRDKAAHWSEEEARLRAEQRALQQRVQEMEALLVAASSKMKDDTRASKSDAEAAKRMKMLEDENKVC